MSKVHTQEQTTVKSVTIELSPDEARRLLTRLGEVSMAQASAFGGYAQQLAARDGLDDLRAQLKQALNGKN